LFIKKNLFEDEFRWPPFIPLKTLILLAFGASIILRRLPRVEVCRIKECATDKTTSNHGQAARLSRGFSFSDR
jgi:hypothetical protein